MIDSYAEGLIDKGEFEPRVTRLRPRLARLEEQRQALADEAALQGELPLIIGRLEDFAAKLRNGLEAADWASKRDLIRTLVKRVEVARDDVNIVFRIDPYPGDSDPGKKSLQLCRGRDHAALRRPSLGMDDLAIRVQNTCLQPFVNQAEKGPVVDTLAQHVQQPRMVHVVKEALDISLSQVAIPSVLEVEGEVADRIQRPPSGAIAVTALQKILLIDGR